MYNKQTTKMDQVQNNMPDFIAPFEIEQEDFEQGAICGLEQSPIPDLPPPHKLHPREQ